MSATSPGSLKRWYLEGVLALFQGLPPEDLDWLEHELQHLRLPKGTQLALDETNPLVYFVKGGVVRLWVMGPDGKELTLAYLKDGASLGSLGGGPADPPCAQGAEVSEEALICQMDAQRFAAFAAERPQLSWRITKLLGWRLQRLQVRLHQLLFLDLPERLEVVISDLAEEHGEAHPEGRLLRWRLTHKDLARLVGASRESTSVAMAQLAQRGRLRTEGQRLLWLKPPQ